MPRRMVPLALTVALAVGVAIAAHVAPPTASARSVPQAPATDGAARIDYLTFAQGAMPVSIGGAGAKLGADNEAAVRITDGDRTAFVIVNRALADTDTEFVYALPAPTTFDRFAVPDITETPSPTTTFTRLVEVYGSPSGPTDGFVLLASATLETHRARGLATELTPAAKTPVRWVKIRLVGGINVLQPQSFFEFSEIIGNGTQEVPALATHFAGAWRRGALKLGLEQAGPVVSGCYDDTGRLTGTVTGNILRATGVTRPDYVASTFILSVAADGGILGVRSTNGGPFRLVTLPANPSGAGGCGQPTPPALGCGSIIHGITFAFDSAEMRPDADGVLAALHSGLQTNTSASIVIEGHTSSEGSEAYNEALSRRRAQAVVADLVARGLTAGRVTAAGLGEVRPIAPNTDESGRSLNRRVEVHCK